MEDYLWLTSREERQDSSSPLRRNAQIYVKDELLGQHFRRHVFWTAAVRGGEIIRSESCLAESEIRDLEVAVHIDHDVLRLDVAVDDILAVQVLQAEENLNEAVPGLIFGHLPHLP